MLMVWIPALELLRSTVTTAFLITASPLFNGVSDYLFISGEMPGSRGRLFRRLVSAPDRCRSSVRIGLHLRV